MSSTNRLSNTYPVHISTRHSVQATKKTRNLISREVTIKLMVLAGISTAFSDLLLYRIDAFAFGVPHILLIILSIAVFSNRGRVNHQILVLWFFMTSLAFWHALVMGFITIPDWQRSFAQYFVYSALFVFITGFSIDKRVLETITPWVLKLGILLGLLAIFQFILFEFGFNAYLSDTWRISGHYNPFLELRAGGFAPAIGLATEPARYAIGLTILLACIIFLGNIQKTYNRTLYYVAIMALIGGVITTFSLSGAIMSVLILFSGFFYSFSRKRLLIGGIVGILILGTIAGGLIDPIQSRFIKVYQGLDNSAQIRVVASTRLLFHSLSETETTFLGTGMGMESREMATYLGIYQDVASRTLGGNINIHNIFSSVRFLQGWLGLVLYLMLFWVILRPLTPQWRLYLPLFTVYGLYHFASGYYLTPEFWSLAALIYVFRSVSLEI